MADNLEDQVKQEQIRQDQIRKDQEEKAFFAKQAQEQEELRKAQIATEDLKKNGLTDASLDAIH